MLIGYVSDENYSALADVCLEFVAPDGRSWATRSRASGSSSLSVDAQISRIKANVLRRFLD